MKQWLAAALGSWVAALATLAAVSVSGVSGESLPLSEWRPAIVATGVLHFALSAALFQPVFYLLDRFGLRDIAPLALALAGFVPLMLFMMAFGGTPADLGTPEARLFASYFVPAGLVFGLVAAHFSRKTDRPDTTPR
jgi:hypothetical protein